MFGWVVLSVLYLRGGISTLFIRYAAFKENISCFGPLSDVWDIRWAIRPENTRSSWKSLCFVKYAPSGSEERSWIMSDEQNHNNLGVNVRSSQLRLQPNGLLNHYCNIPQQQVSTGRSRWHPSSCTCAECISLWNIWRRAELRSRRPTLVWFFFFLQK